MLNAGRILKSISQPKDGEAPISTFINWLAYSCEAEDLMTPELISTFFQECLDYPHWQQNSRVLGEEVRYLLETLCQQIGEVVNFEEVLMPARLQVVEIEHLSDWVDAVNGYLTAQHAADKFRLLHDEALQKIIAVILKNDGRLSVRQFSRKFFIRNGALTPLREDLALHYDPHFDLQPGVPQKIEIGPYMTARFLSENGAPFGTIARGYFFQKFQALNGAELDRSPRLFYTLKRLEQHFLKRESDPFYQELVDSIEHSIRLMKIGDDGAIERSPDLLSQAQNALEHVFIGDKLLSLLVRDLQYTMAGRKPVARKKDEKAWSPTLPPPRPQRSDLTN